MIHKRIAILLLSKNIQGPAKVHLGSHDLGLIVVWSGSGQDPVRVCSGSGWGLFGVCLGSGQSLVGVWSKSDRSPVGVQLGSSRV